ncbi:DUF397 domain-containing protein, partial [Streptomyces sp. NPDC002671]
MPDPAEPGLSAVTWEKSPFSGGNDNSVEFGAISEFIAVPGPKRPEQTPLVHTRDEIRAMILGAKAGTFDHLIRQDASAVRSRRTSAPASGRVRPRVRSEVRRRPPADSSPRLAAVSGYWRAVGRAAPPARVRIARCTTSSDSPTPTASGPSPPRHNDSEAAPDRCSLTSARSSGDPGGGGGTT